MLNDTTKRKINSLRQILVGKVPDPKSQVDQITNALIYKYMDDMDRQSEVYGGKASFFVGEYAKYSWKNLMDPKKGGQERMNLYVEALEKMATNKKLSPIFRDILKGAFLPYRSPETLNMFLHEIDGFTYDHSEDLGDAFEHLLSIMGSQGDAGQFRTPRHIIDFMVDVIDPQKSETILDPACGTAGFLISAYKHILDSNIDKKTGASILHDERKILHENFTGYDLDPGMVKLSRVNMFLHNFPEPRIFEYDTLSDDSRWNETFDIIMANPPFMTPKGGIIPHKRFGIQANRAEVLFVDYIMEHLKPKGRAAIIVPEGIIFQSANAYKQLRKALVEDGLIAVVSLPSGVFNPYAGVKTSILFFDNQLVNNSDELLFVKVENDGFDLGAQRRPIEKNDLQEAAKILLAWRNGKKIESKLAYWVKKSEIAKDDNYNLSGDRYRVETDYTNVKWPMVQLKEVCEVQNGFAFDSSLFNEAKGFPIIRIRDIKKNATKTKYDGDDFDFDLIVKNGDLLVGMDGEFNAVLWNGGDALLNQRVCRIRNFKGVISEYIYWSIQNELKKIEDSTYAVTVKHISSKQVQSIKIPLPPLEIQKQIVVELDGYQKIIDGARQVVENWKPKIEIDLMWNKVKIGEVAKLMTGGTPLTSKREYYGGDIKWLVSGDIHKGEIFDCDGRITRLALEESNARLLPVNSVLIALNGQGKTRGTVAILRTEAACNQSLVSINPEKDKLLSEFLLYVLKGKYQEIRNINGDNQRGGLNMPIIRSIEIPLPPLKIQKQIVEKIESERALVKSNKKLIEIYEQKIKDKIYDIWKG